MVPATHPSAIAVPVPTVLSGAAGVGASVDGAETSFVVRADSEALWSSTDVLSIVGSDTLVPSILNESTGGRMSVRRYSVRYQTMDFG